MPPFPFLPLSSIPHLLPHIPPATTTTPHTSRSTQHGRRLTVAPAAPRTATPSPSLTPHPPSPSPSSPTRAASPSPILHSQRLPAGSQLPPLGLVTTTPSCCRRAPTTSSLSAQRFPARVHRTLLLNKGLGPLLDSVVVLDKGEEIPLVFSVVALDKREEIPLVVSVVALDKREEIPLVFSMVALDKREEIPLVFSVVALDKGKFSFLVCMSTGNHMSMFRTMVSQLVKHERIETIVAKAKEIRRMADNMFQLGKEVS
ncbi:hypothetical protein Droror1_Dr00026549 [Drosera rotundifolia]